MQGPPEGPSGETSAQPPAGPPAESPGQPPACPPASPALHGPIDGGAATQAFPGCCSLSCPCHRHRLLPGAARTRSHRGHQHQATRTSQSPRGAGDLSALHHPTKVEKKMMGCQWPSQHGSPPCPPRQRWPRACRVPILPPSPGNPASPTLEKRLRPCPAPCSYPEVPQPGTNIPVTTISTPPCC